MSSFPKAHVWTRENIISSNAEVQKVSLFGLPDGAQDLRGEWVRVRGQTALQGQFLHPPFVEGRDNFLTQDPFDQAFSYFILDIATRYLTNLGIDVTGIIAGRHNGRFQPVEAHVNLVADMNAWYDPRERALFFGRGVVDGKERGHLASDGDVVIHEYWHLLFDHILPGLTGRIAREGGAIHEGGGDASAALLFDDPEMGESFALFLGKRPHPKKGLRVVNHRLTLSDVTEEVHNRGRVYGGFFWSLKEWFAEHIGLGSREAADLGIQLLFNHGGNYRTRRPRPQDFVEAMLRGASALADREMNFPLKRVQEAILKEAGARGLVGAQVAIRRPRFATFESARNFYTQGRAPSAFGLTNRTPYQGGFQEQFYQYLMSHRFGAVPVLGAGMLVNYPIDRGLPLVSVRDTRLLRQGEIDETVRVDLETALGNIKRRLEEEAERAEKAWESLSKPPADRDAFLRLQQANRDLLFWDRCRLAFAKHSPKGRVSFVVFPTGRHLVYQFDFGGIVFYVNAYTGTVHFHQEVFT